MKAKWKRKAIAKIKFQQNEKEKENKYEEAELGEKGNKLKERWMKETRNRRDVC